MRCQARWPNKCPLCQIDYEVGTWLSKENVLGRWAHELCPMAPIEAAVPTTTVHRVFPAEEQ